MPYDDSQTQISTNIGSGNGMLPDSTKPFPEPMLIIREVLSHSPVGSLQEMSHISILDMSSKITSSTMTSSWGQWVNNNP